jgi:hypothetical protein
LVRACLWVVIELPFEFTHLLELLGDIAHDGGHTDQLSGFVPLVG